MKNRRSGFTLVELLVVIGIIALLISILLPALGRARESANNIKCSANLHAIGQGLANYEANYKGAIPASNFYYGLQINQATQTQTPAQPNFQDSGDPMGGGYVHWSSYLYSGNHTDPNDPVFSSLSGWEMFQCPSLDNGGIAAANTFPGNNDQGISNEAGVNFRDLQAPRLAYMLNEALTPRSIFVVGFRSAKRPYHFVNAGRVRHSGDTIMATEMWGVQSMMSAKSNTGGGPASNSRRPVSGISLTATNALGGSIDTCDHAYLLDTTHTFGWATPANLQPDPLVYYKGQVPPAPDTALDFVGRNHGQKKYGSVAGDTRGGWDLRRSNFLYVDGHVESKNVSETVFPHSQWGDEFYSLDQ